MKIFSIRFYKNHQVKKDILNTNLDKELKRKIKLPKKQGFKLEDVKFIAKLINRNEYKRRQSAPGIRITTRAFGKDRRYPITSGYGRSRK